MSARAEKAVVALRFRAEGKTAREIAAALGVSRSYAASLYLDPTGDGDRERKRRYSGTCLDCGGATSGNDGIALAPKRCASCRKAYEQTEEGRREMSLAKMVWTKRRIIAAIQDWAAVYDEAPGVCDWNPCGARQMGDEERALRYEREAERWPGFTSVFRRFGTWNAAIEAAGFAPRVANGGGGNMLRRRRKTHCKYGHEFTPANTLVRADHCRSCRACARRRSHDYYYSHKAAE